MLSWKQYCSALRPIKSSKIDLVVCDLSASPHIDLAGARMLDDLYSKLTSQGSALRIVAAHGSVRDLLRADGMDVKVGGLDRFQTLDRLLDDRCR